MKKSDVFWQTYLNLEKEVIEVSKFIFITDVKTVNEKGMEVQQTCKTQLETFSPHLADLPITSDSPYVVTYQDDVYQRIDEIRKNEGNALKEYLTSQPEWQEQAFVSQIQEAIKNNPSSFIIWCELGKYRLNKKIPSTLAFEERKDSLIKSAEWNGWINQHNKHLEPDEITEENIQREIDETGTRWGLELLKRVQKLAWVPIATNSGLCKVYIPQ